MPPAIIAAGVVGAATIGGAALSSSAQKKAAKQAAASQQQATDSQLQLGRENINFQQGIYDQNKALLSPFVSRGNVAGESINALLGLPQAPAIASQPSAGSTGGVDWAGYVRGNPDALSDWQRFHSNMPLNEYGQYHYGADGSRRDLTPYTPTATTPHNGGTISGDNVTPITAQNAFNNFANSAGMQFQLQQGSNALNNLYAGHGSLQSGAAAKALQNYGQQTALNNYFLPYLNLLGGQQAVGAQSGSAIAGVGSNFGNTVSNIYGQQSNAIQNAADAASNAALLRGQANSNLYSGIASGLGGLASSFVPIRH
jgi:hypothetical protein